MKHAHFLVWALCISFSNFIYGMDHGREEERSTLLSSTHPMSAPVNWGPIEREIVQYNVSQLARYGINLYTCDGFTRFLENPQNISDYLRTPEELEKINFSSNTKVNESKILHMAYVLLNHNNNYLKDLDESRQKALLAIRDSSKAEDNLSRVTMALGYIFTAESMTGAAGDTIADIFRDPENRKVNIKGIFELKPSLPLYTFFQNRMNQAFEYWKEKSERLRTEEIARIKAQAQEARRASTDSEGSADSHPSTTSSGSTAATTTSSITADEADYPHSSIGTVGTPKSDGTATLSNSTALAAIDENEANVITDEYNILGEGEDMTALTTPPACGAGSSSPSGLRHRIVRSHT